MFKSWSEWQRCQRGGDLNDSIPKAELEVGHLREPLHIRILWSGLRVGLCLLSLFSYLQRLCVLSFALRLSAPCGQSSELDWEEV